MNAKIWLLGLTVTGALFSTASVAGPAAPSPTIRPVKALSTLQTGQWGIRSRDNPEANRSFCMADANALLQLRHPTNICSRYVISDGDREATVQYSCAADGNGRTSIRVETPRLVQVETQGVADQMPFAFSAEARRIGNCPAKQPGIAARPNQKPRLGIR